MQANELAKLFQENFQKFDVADSIAPQGLRQNKPIRIAAIFIAAIL